MAEHCCVEQDFSVSHNPFMLCRGAKMTMEQSLSKFLFYFFPTDQTINKINFLEFNLAQLLIN